jgi:hypothetical protein
VGAAAEFLGLAHGQHAHGVAVLLAEERHGAFLLGFGDGQHLGLDGQVAQHALVGQIFHASAFVLRHGRQVREVEAQAIRRDQRSLLRHVGAEHRAQGPVQKVGGRVVAANGVAALDVDGELERVADLQLPWLTSPRCT